MDEINPYAAPQAEVLATDEDAVRARYEHLRTESHLKALGILYGVSAFTAVIFKMWRMRFLGRMFDMEVDLTRVPFEDVVMSSLFVLVGIGIAKLQMWAALLAGFVSVSLIVINLTELPAGIVTIVFHLFIIRFLLLRNTRVVFSNAYRTVLCLTPQIRSAPARWIRPVLFLQIICLAIAWWSYA